MIMFDRYLFRNVFWALSLPLLVAACSDEEKYDALESQKIISEINLKVSDPLPLLVNTDSLVAYEVFPEDADNKNVVWSSDNEEIASVDAEGRIYANSCGTVFITVASEVGFAQYGSKTFEVEVIDRIIPIQEIKVENEDLSVYATAKIQLETSYSPADATYSSMAFTSLTPDVATVTEDGVVEGLVPGTATIRISARDGGGYYKDVEVTVKEVVPLTGISFAEGQGEIALHESSVFTIVPEPAEATTAVVRWSSADNNVVSIDEETGVYTVNGYGSTTITARSGDVEGTISVTVAQGKINDDFRYGCNWAGFDRDFGSVEVEDGKLVVTPGTNRNASIQRIPDTDFHPGNYPIVAIKRTDPATSYSMQMDIWTDSDTGTFGGRYGMGSQKLTGADGVPVYYVDLTEATFGSTTLPANEVSFLDFFLYRMNGLGETEGISYEVYWVKSFKSLDELKEYIGAE